MWSVPHVLFVNGSAHHTAYCDVLRVNVRGVHGIATAHTNKHPSVAIKSLKAWEEDHILPRGGTGMKSMVRSDLCGIRVKRGEQSGVAVYSSGQGHNTHCANRQITEMYLCVKTSKAYSFTKSKKTVRIIFISVFTLKIGFPQLM